MTLRPVRSRHSRASSIGDRCAEYRRNIASSRSPLSFPTQTSFPTSSYICVWFFLPFNTFILLFFFTIFILTSVVVCLVQPCPFPDHVDPSFLLLPPSHFPGLISIFFCIYHPGFRWRHSWIGHVEWRLLQRFDADHAVAARQPNPVDFRCSGRRWWTARSWEQLGDEDVTRNFSPSPVSNEKKKTFPPLDSSPTLVKTFFFCFCLLFPLPSSSICLRYYYICCYFYIHLFFPSFFLNQNHITRRGKAEMRQFHANVRWLLPYPRYRRLTSEQSSALQQFSADGTIHHVQI